MAGGCAGVAEWTVGLPLDRIKTLVQSGECANFSAALRSILRERGGAVAFYRGFVPMVLCRAFPANAAAFLTIDAFEKNFFR